VLPVNCWLGVGAATCCHLPYVFTLFQMWPTSEWNGNSHVSSSRAVLKIDKQMMRWTTICSLKKKIRNLKNVRWPFDNKLDCRCCGGMAFCLADIILLLFCGRPSLLLSTSCIRNMDHELRKINKDLWHLIMRCYRRISLLAVKFQDCRRYKYMCKLIRTAAK